VLHNATIIDATIIDNPSMRLIECWRGTNYWNKMLPSAVVTSSNIDVSSRKDSEI